MKVSGVLPNISISLSDVRVQEVLSLVQSIPFPESAPVEEEEEEFLKVIDWLIDWTLFLNGEDTSTKADSRICRCCSTTNIRDICSEILLEKDIDKYSISENKIENK